jgi:hypothetical protein
MTLTLAQCPGQARLATRVSMLRSCIIAAELELLHHLQARTISALQN